MPAIPGLTERDRTTFNTALEVPLCSSWISWTSSWRLSSMNRCSCWWPSFVITSWPLLAVFSLDRNRSPMKSRCILMTSWMGTCLRLWIIWLNLGRFIYLDRHARMPALSFCGFRHGYLCSSIIIISTTGKWSSISWICKIRKPWFIRGTITFILARDWNRWQIGLLEALTIRHLVGNSQVIRISLYNQHRKR